MVALLVEIDLVGVEAAVEVDGEEATTTITMTRRHHTIRMTLGTQSRDTELIRAGDRDSGLVLRAVRLLAGLLDSSLTGVIAVGVIKVVDGVPTVVVEAGVAGIMVVRAARGVRLGTAIPVLDMRVLGSEVLRGDKGGSECVQVVVFSQLA